METQTDPAVDSVAEAIAIAVDQVVPDPEVQPTMTVPDAGRLFGLGRAASYHAAARGDIPTISFGRRRVVPTAAVRQKLGLT